MIKVSYNNLALLNCGASIGRWETEAGLEHGHPWSRGRRPTAAQGWKVFHLPSTPRVLDSRPIGQGRSGFDLRAM